MIDPRLSIISERLADVKEVIAVSGGKGGVGKSVVACTIALVLSNKGKSVGLLDIDLTSPSTHTILGVKNIFPKEENGILPPQIGNIKYMSIIFYSKNATPLRGIDVSNAIIELLCVTRWGNLDYLVIDMPPGITDATLDVIRFVSKAKFLLVTTPSILSWETTEKMIEVLKQSNAHILGVFENMKASQDSYIERKAYAQEVKYLGSMAYRKDIESMLGNPGKLSLSEFAKEISLLF